MILEDGRLYTPDEVSENGWLGPDTTALAIRTAATRGEIQHTRFRGRIYLTRANILAIQDAGFQPAKQDRAEAAAPRRGRRTPATNLPAGVEQLRPRPNAARRRRAS